MSSTNTSSSTSNTNNTYESSLDQLRSLLPNSNAKGMSDYDVVRSATDYIQTLMKDSGTTSLNDNEKNILVIFSYFLYKLFLIFICINKYSNSFFFAESAKYYSNNR